MAVIFYPHEDELESGSLDQKLDVLLESAQRYKAVVLDTSGQYKQSITGTSEARRFAPKDIEYAWNWEGLAKVLREVRELPESSSSAKLAKGMKMHKLAEVYEVLRGARMPKLEAVRIALASEARQLGASVPSS